MMKLKRVYLPVENSDGYRVLVDGLWPRGLKKDEARIDEWLKEIAPSAGLRQWFGHAIERWPEFSARYRAELSNARAIAHLDRLRRLDKNGVVTLLFAARDELHNNAVVVQSLVREG